RPQGAGPPARLLQRLARGRLGRRLALVDPAAGDLPAPGVGDEAMAPEEQDAALRVVDDRRRRLGRQPQDVVLEARAGRKLDVDEAEVHVLALVERPLAVD